LLVLDIELLALDLSGIVYLSFSPISEAYFRIYLR
jgi:hypothetical protein